MKYILIPVVVFNLLLYSACSGKRNPNNDNYTKEKTSANLTDTMKFTSGIRSILQDSKGNYWFGSDQEGFCKYDGNTFTYYILENGVYGKQVINIEEDNTGQIWFGTSSGLCCFDGKSFLTERQFFPFQIIGDKLDNAWSASSSDLWFPGKNKDELIRIENGKIHALKYPIKTLFKGNSMDMGITGFSMSKSGGLWIAHYSGVSYYDGKTYEFISDSTMHFNGKSKYMHVRSILEDSKGRLWIGNNGIGVLLKEKDSIIHFSEKHNLFKGEMFQVKSPEGTLMHVFAIKEDSKGNIWFGDRDTGAWRFDGKEMKNFKLDSNLNTQHIWDIYEDKRGNLLFASGDRGVYKFNGNGFDRAF